jgi:hypothetical protein
MTKNEMKKYLMIQYEIAHDSMMNYRKDIKLYNEYYGKRQSFGSVLVDCGFMTKNELQLYLNELNKKYDYEIYFK